MTLNDNFIGIRRCGMMANEITICQEPNDKKVFKKLVTLHKSIVDGEKLLTKKIIINIIFFYSLVMYLKLTPIELNLYALVTLEVDIGVAKFTKTLFKATLWSYKAPTITKKLIDNRKDEEDKTPPDISPFTDGADTNRKKRVMIKCIIVLLSEVP